MIMLEAERAELLRIRDAGTVDQEVLGHVFDQLDIEESMLDRIEERSDELREDPLLPPERAEDECEHLAAHHDRFVAPTSPHGCEECLRDGTTWVHLRLCLDCGHVGCCDSSPQKHASAHFREDEPPGDAQLRTRRVLALVLRRRPARLSVLGATTSGYAARRPRVGSLTS